MRVCAPDVGDVVGADTHKIEDLVHDLCMMDFCHFTMIAHAESTARLGQYFDVMAFDLLYI